MTRWTKARRIALALLALGGLLLLMVWGTLLRMPGKSHQGPLDPLDEPGRALASELERHVRALATEIGERNVARPEALGRAADYVAGELAQSGRPVARQSFPVGGVACDNLEIEIAGKSEPKQVVIVGAHYDSAQGTPGANDNASGTAALLALAARFAARAPSKTVRFVAFVNEEPPHFQTADMGSLRYARRSRERGEAITAMLSLETIGYFSDAPGSQHYPFPLGLFYPSRGDFIGFVGNPASRELLRRVVGTFRREARFPSEGAAAPAVLPGIGWSDQWAFWEQGYPALMVTDTAPFRYPHYHQPSDTPERVDAARMARVVLGLERVIADLID